VSARSHVTTHVLDAARGRPAAGVPVTLETLDGAVLAATRTDADGRVGDLGPERLDPGAYRLRFDTAAWFAAEGLSGLYPEVAVAFVVDQSPDEPGGHYHVPLLLSPYAYSTYRGS